MTTLFGDKRRFAAEVGEIGEENPELRRVDLWAAGRLWTCDDNTAFVPQFSMSLHDTVRWLRSGRDLSVPFPGLSAEEAHRQLLLADDGSRERFWFPRWGPTTDNVTAHVFREATLLSIPFEFWRPTHPRPDELGVVFVARLSESELIAVLEHVLAALQSGRGIE